MSDITGIHPSHAGMPFAEMVLRQGILDVLAVVDSAMAQTADYSSEEFETKLMAHGITAALPGLMRLIPEDVAFTYAEGITRNVLASIRWSLANGCEVKPMGGRLQ